MVPRRSIFLIVCILAADVGPNMLRADPTLDDIPESAPPRLRRLIQETFSQNALARSRAADELGQMREDAALAVPFLIRLLTDEASVGDKYGMTVSLHASAALKKIGKPTVPFCLAAIKHSSGEMRLALISVLGDFDDPRAVGAIGEMMAHWDAKVRWYAIHALADSRSAQAVLPLVKALEDVDPELRAAAAWALQYVPDPRAVEPLIKMLADKSPHVRASATDSLGYQKDGRAVPFLLAILNDGKQGSIREVAATALGRLRDPRAVEPLVRVLQEEQVVQVRSAAALGLGLSGDVRAIEPLKIVLRDTHDHPQVRQMAAEAVANLEERTAIELLSEIAKTPGDSARVRFWAAMNVIRVSGGAIDDVEVLSSLKGYYDDSEPTCALWMRMDEQEKALKRVIQDGKTQAVRAEARRVLELSKGSDAVQEDTPAALSVPTLGMLLFAVLALLLAFMHRWGVTVHTPGSNEGVDWWAR